MTVRLIESLATTEPLADVFSDASVLRAMLAFEAALARVEARLNIIPEDAARAIAEAAVPESFDAAAIAREAARTATPGVPFLKALVEQTRRRSPAATGFVHWGATSQDLCDTALVLLLGKAQPLLESDLERLRKALRRLSQQHRSTVMLSRTLLQAAPPTTFGLKAAGWLGAVQRSRKQLRRAFQEGLVAQLGGASGTVAALGDQGLQVGQALAGELKLGYPEAPWHAHRDRLAVLVCACGVVVGTLGKIARDISLLTQNEVGEAAEGSENRGGSSTMPHKHNPVGCALTLAAASRVPALVSSFLSGMVQEHERGLGSLQAEWSIVCGVIQATGMAGASMADVAEGLTIDRSRMSSNLDATQGVIFAERAVMLLSPTLGRDFAQKTLEEATRRCRQEKRRLRDVLAEMKEVTGRLEPAVLHELESPEQYLGAAGEFQDRLLAAADPEDGGHGHKKE